MASTPPPPRRIHTPPTPLHGPKYDSYEPYSPRRSSRLSKHASTPSPRYGSSPLSKSQLTATPPATTNNPCSRQSIAFSSPPATTSPKKQRARERKAVSPRPASSGSDTDILPEKAAAAGTSAARATKKDIFGMLNTPAKTPSRKRKDMNGSEGAKRLLFGDNEGLLDPTPSRRRNRALDLFADMHGETRQTNGNGMKIFVDSKERVPSVGGDDEDNPFLSKNAGKASTKGKARRRSKESKEMEEKARNEEGMVYVFRGKKIFRKFDSSAPASPQQLLSTGSPTQPTHAGAPDEDADDNLSDLEVLRKAGTAATSRPFTRSSLKPRLLFPSEEQKREREERAVEADEEAVSDIEMPRPARNLSTPTKQASFASKIMSPPKTSAKGRRTSAGEQLQRELGDAAEKVQDLPIVTPPAVERKRRGVFDGYQRRKAGVAPAQGRKREGSPTGGEGTAAKRTRSAVSS